MVCQSGYKSATVNAEHLRIKGVNKGNEKPYLHPEHKRVLEYSQEVTFERKAMIKRGEIFAIRNSGLVMLLPKVYKAIGRVQGV